MLVSFRFRSPQTRLLRDDANFGIGTPVSYICWWPLYSNIRKSFRRNGMRMLGSDHQPLAGIGGERKTEQHGFGDQHPQAFGERAVGHDAENAD